MKELYLPPGTDKQRKRLRQELSGIYYALEDGDSDKAKGKVLGLLIWYDRRCNGALGRQPPANSD